MIKLFKRLYYQTIAGPAKQREHTEAAIKKIAKLVNDNVGECGALFLSPTEFALHDTSTSQVYLFAQVVNNGFDAVIYTNKSAKTTGVIKELVKQFYQVIVKEKGGEIMSESISLAYLKEDSILLIGDEAESYLKSMNKELNLTVLKNNNKSKKEEKRDD